MYDDIICDFDFTYDTFTGKTEHVDFTDIDRAVGGFFQHVAHSLTVSDTERKTNQEFVRFADRDAQTKVFIGTFADEEDFLKKLVAKYCTPKGGRLRKDLLPACYVSRDPTVSFAEQGEYVDITGAAELTDQDGNVYAMLNKSFVRLTYNVTALAWSEPTLERLVLGLMLWVRHDKAGAKHRFTAKTKIAGCQVESNISLVVRRDPMGDAGGLSFDDTRVVSKSMSFEVIAEVFEAEEIVRNTGRVEIAGGTHIE